MHSCICGSCGSDWSMRYADTHKGASMSAARIYRLLLSGCGGTRATFALLHGHLIRSFVLHPFVPYTAVLGLVYAVADTAADKPRQAAHRNALQAIIYVACTCHYCGKLYSQNMLILFAVFIC